MKSLMVLCMLLSVAGAADAKGQNAPSSLATTGVWCADLGNGRYQNPVLYADYSDPDVIRTGDDYWMTSSSFNCVPGLQILHSTDLVNWQLVNAVFREQTPLDLFNRPAHGNGVWAPAIRYHNGWYFIYWGDPDQGILMTRTQDPRGAWSQPLLIKAAKGIIDTCPLWDDDGRAYLVHGWAGSRAGFKSVLSVSEMAADGTRLIGEEVLIFDGHDDHPTVEGPKFYKRNGYYYVFAPAGGVKPGWQLVLRSRSPWGPYQCRKVLHQGNTATAGPHQGAWVEDIAGDSWFVHFVDCYAYGRVVHLQPMHWSQDDWCIIGVDDNGDGVGEPVASYAKPSSRHPSPILTPATGDEFSGRELGWQWQWHANPQTGWYFNNPTQGTLRLMCVKHPSEWCNLWDTPNLLLQKIAAPNCVITTKITFRGAYEGDRAGFVVMGMDYAAFGVELRDSKLTLTLNACRNAHQGTVEQCCAEVPLTTATLELRCRIEHHLLEGVPHLICHFAYRVDGEHFTPIGTPFTAREGRWIGAKVGYFATAELQKNDGGRLDIDWFREEKSKTSREAPLGL